MKLTKTFRDDYDRLKDNGIIVEVKDGYIGVFFSNCGLKDGVFMEANDTRIVKSDLKTLTATVFEDGLQIGQTIDVSAQFNGISGSCGA